MKTQKTENEKIEALNSLLAKNEQSNQNKIEKYKKYIEEKKQAKYKKLQDDLTFWNEWINIQKSKEEKIFKNENLKNEKWYEDKISEELLDFKKNNITNKYNFKKSFLLEQHKEQQVNLLKKYETKINNANKKYQEGIEDLEWDYKNYIEGLDQELKTYQKNKLEKIKYIEDKQNYKLIIEKQGAALKSKIDIETDIVLKKELQHQYKKLAFSVVEKNKLIFKPFKVNLFEKIQLLKDDYKNKFYKFKKNITNIRFLSVKEMIKNTLKFEFFNVPVWLYIIMVGAVLTAIYTKTLPHDTMGAMGVLFLIAIIGGEIFRRLPIWKKYIGGATMGVFFLGAILGTFNAFPASIVDTVNNWFNAGGFLNLYINILIVGSILTIPRKLIFRSFSGFIFILFAGVVISVIFALGFGALSGIPLDKNVLQLMLPLLSAGNGGGVQPLSSMSAAAGYLSKEQYLSFGLAVSTLSNVFVIIIAALLAAAFDKSPSLSGNGRLVKKEIRINEEKVTPTNGNICAGLILALIIYIFSSFLEKEIKSATNVDINAFAWVVIIALVINLSNILPKNLKAGTGLLNQFFTKQFTLLIMAGVGLCMTNLRTFISLFENWKYVTIILLMDFGLILGPLLLAKLIKFYTLESMIAAGCCMGAQGGAGALAVLSASKRMDLVPYSQITARIAGGLVLVAAAPLFTAFVNAGHSYMGIN